MLIDSHLHLHHENYAPDFDRVLARAADAGVERMICIGESIGAARKAIALAERHPQVLATAGIHPGHVDEYSPAAMAELGELLKSDRIVALGEIGLDYHYPGYDAPLQKRAFTEQAHLAAERGLPIVIHCRDAYDDLLAMVRADERIPRRGVVHCFSGTPEQAAAFAELGFYIGIGAAITYPNAGMLRDVARAVGLGKIVAETDAPYLAPQSKRGRRNEPAYVHYAVAGIAQACGASYWDAATQTTANTIKMYGLLPSPSHPSHPSPPPSASVLLLNFTQQGSAIPADAWLPRLVAQERAHAFRFNHDSSLDEILAAAAGSWSEIVLGGRGEPLARRDTCLAAARALRARGAKIGLLTGGAATDARDLTGLFDSVRIWMPSPHATPFATACRDCVPEITLLAPLAPELDVEAARALAQDTLGVRFRIVC